MTLDKNAVTGNRSYLLLCDADVVNVVDLLLQGSSTTVVVKSDGEERDEEEPCDMELRPAAHPCTHSAA